MRISALGGTGIGLICTIIHTRHVEWIMLKQIKDAGINLCGLTVKRAFYNDDSLILDFTNGRRFRFLPSPS